MGEGERQHRPEGVQIPQKRVDPLGIISTTAITLKKMMATYGVLYFGCTRLMMGGSWRCSPIEYVSLETPMMPALVAMIRIVAARNPT